ncbi:hypothetical protein ACH36K_10535 [Clostridium sp. MB05]|uniref:hypothetical protein n=1 Tax=Clostridium sp. MB05 TaxID=3376682 RepID=UPI0039827E80
MTLNEAIKVIEDEELNRYKKITFHGKDIEENQIGIREIKDSWQVFSTNERGGIEIIEDFNISLIEDGKSPKIIESHVGDIKAFIEFQKAKGVDFNGTLQRFYVTSYKVFLVDKILFYIQN